MKNLKLFIFSLFLIILYSFPSCDTSSVSGSLIEESTKPITVSVTTRFTETKALAVDLSISIAEYVYKAMPKYSINNGNVAGTQATWKYFCNSNEDQGSMTLAPGLWTITIGAVDENNAVIYEGSADICVSPSFTGTSIILRPSSGTGQINLSVIAPFISNTASLTAKYKKIGSDEVTTSLNVSGTNVSNKTTTYTKNLTNLDTGCYIVSLLYEDGNKKVGLTLTAKVLNGQTTTISGNLEKDWYGSCIVKVVFDNSSTAEYEVESGDLISSVINKISILDNIVYEQNLYSQAEGGSAYSLSYEITDDLTVYAHRKKYSLSWDYQGGSVQTAGSAAGSYPNGATITAPVLTKSGYSFSSWSPAFSSLMPTSNKLYVAQWNANSYTITFNQNGGNTPSPTSKSVTFASEYGTLASVTRAGHSFAGWYTDASAGTKVESASTVSITANQILYAHWNANIYNILYKDKGNVSFSGTHASGYPTTHTYGSATTLKSASKTGYSFNGWFTSSDCSGSAISSLGSTSYTADISLYAKWTANSYTVTFDKNGGNTPSVGSKSVTYGSTYGELATITRTGHTLDGWYTAASGGTKIQSSTTVSITANQTLYAHWNTDSYSISYDLHNGISPGTANPTTYTYGVGVASFYSPTRTGYSFKGWFDAASGGNQITSISSSSTGNKTLHAQWTVNTYSLTYELHEGSGPSSANPNSYTYGVGVSSFNSPTRTGYTFKGWFDSASGGNQITYISSTSTGNKTLHAQWTVNQFTVTFNGNNGTTPNPTSKTVTYGSTYGDLASSSRTGHTFDGWYTAVSGGTKILSSTTVSITANQTLYAHWNANSFTVYFNKNGGNYPSVGSKSVTYGSTYGALATITRKGYSFNGWFTLSSGGSLVSSSTTVSITSNQNLYAQWNANTYTVTFNYDGGTDSNSQTSSTKQVTYDQTYGTLPTVTKQGYTLTGWVLVE